MHGTHSLYLPAVLGIGSLLSGLCVMVTTGTCSPQLPSCPLRNPGSKNFPSHYNKLLRWIYYSFWVMCPFLDHQSQGHRVFWWVSPVLQSHSPVGPTTLTPSTGMMKMLLLPEEAVQVLAVLPNRQKLQVTPQSTNSVPSCLHISFHSVNHPEVEMIISILQGRKLRHRLPCPPFPPYEHFSCSGLHGIS